LSLKEDNPLTPQKILLEKQLQPTLMDKFTRDNIKMASDKVMENTLSQMPIFTQASLRQIKRMELED
jgi:hypothetical protein